jgi:hypothetical protein
MAVESGRAPGGNQHPAGPTSSASTDANDAWAQWQAQAAAAWQRQPASDDSGRPGSSSSTGNDVRSASDRRRVQRLNDLSQPATSTRGPEQENAGPLVQTGGAFSCLPAPLIGQLLPQILMCSGSDDLLLDTARCALVHPQWWRALRHTDAYAADIENRDTLRWIRMAFIGEQRYMREDSELYRALPRAFADRVGRAPPPTPRMFNVGIQYATGQDFEQGCDNGYQHNGNSSLFISSLSDPAAKALAAALSVCHSPILSCPQYGPARRGRLYDGVSFAQTGLRPAGLLAVIRSIPSGLGPIENLYLKDNQLLGDEYALLLHVCLM